MTAGWTCAYCGGAAFRGEHVAREAMFGLDGRFTYRECSHCGSWTIASVPGDLARYYPAQYQSLGSADDPPLKRWLKRRRFEASRGAPDLIGRLLLARFGPPNIGTWLEPLALGRESAILDVGSGNGHLLAQLRDVGFRRLTGVDPFIAPDAARAGITLLRGEIDQVAGRYDLVMFHHSLEHTRDPARDLAAAAARLVDQGHVLVRIPLVGSQAQRHYGVNWSQLDAPR
ncbi:MAG TPA: methyltransferase domain-containing protein, partial [Steroidobacteraceae bacterium]|nr:methyltransferase domain-containing protein [Steroidobacteraceae bacterium]